jgi:tetratricopeptide (TPR) repeat protein
LLVGSASALAQKVPADSTRATITQRVGLDEVTIVYYRPNVHGRKIWGALIPYGMVWRTGANYPTFVTFPDATAVEGKHLPAGQYALYTIPREKSWTIIFSRNLKLWGAFGYQQADDALRVEVQPVSTEFTETFTIGFCDLGDDRATITLQWERLKIPIRISVDIHERVLSSVKDTIAGGKADWGTYWKGAQYLLKHSREPELAMQWIDKSIELQPNEWMNLWTKARLLAARGDYKAALEYGEKAIENGKEKENAPYFGYEVTWRNEMQKWKQRL